MRERRSSSLKLDAIRLIAVFLFAVYSLLSIAWCRRYNPDHLLWFCDIALLLTAVGLFFRSATLVTAQLVAILVFHVAWNLDFWLFLVFGYMPFGSTAYMFYHDLSPYEKVLSFFSHVFVVPAALYGVYVLGVSRRAWLVQTAQTILIFFLTYLLTRPEENINWMFGSDFLNTTPSSIHPALYYCLMGIVPTVIVYLPTNKLLTAMADRQKWRKRNEANSRADKSSIAVTGPSSRRDLVAVTIAVVLASATSVAVAHIADARCIMDPAIFEATLEGPTRFETQPVTLTSRVNQIQFGEGHSVRQLPLLVWPHPTLPKQWSGLDRKLHAHTKSVLLEVSATDLPAAPQEVVLRGTRTVAGSVVWAYVASDDFYLQGYPDLHGERSGYEVRCKVGNRGLSEFVDSITGQLFVSTGYNEILGGGTGAIYVLGVVESREGNIVAKSPYYLVKRKGIRFPEDVWFMPANRALVPLLSNPTEPLNSRVAFQSPLNSTTDMPEVFTCNFFGYDIRNLSNNPQRFDGFISSDGKPFESVGWVDHSALQYCTEREGGWLRLRIVDRQ